MSIGKALRLEKGSRVEKGVVVTKLVLTIQLFVAARRQRLQEDGATAVEYSLMVGLIAVGIITGVTFFGERVAEEYNVISNTIPTGAG